jgi:hypothetical protein
MRPTGSVRAIVGWVQPTGPTPFAVSCTHPTNGSPVPALLYSGWFESTRVAHTSALSPGAS